MVRPVLPEPAWKGGLIVEDDQAPPSLENGHIHPYELLSLNLDQRLGLEPGQAAYRLELCQITMASISRCGSTQLRYFRAWMGPVV